LLVRNIMMKALKSTLLIVAVCVPTAFVSEKAQAYESWEIPFSNETFNAPMQREQGGQEYGNNWCQGVWNTRSSWKPYVASVDGRQIATLSVNHIWYHWSNRQCIANINGTAVAPEFKDVPTFPIFDAPTFPIFDAPTFPIFDAPTFPISDAPTFPIFTDSTPPASHKSQEVSTLFVQDSDLDYNCRSVYGSQAYLSDSRGGNDLFICKAPSSGTFTMGAGFPSGIYGEATSSNGETVDKPALSKKHLCGNAAVNANGGDRSNITDWRYDGSSNQCYMRINVFQ
jgi:hypothetical protein